MTVVDGPPIVEVLQPANGATFTVGGEVIFEGSATDHVDGALSDASLQWTSNLDGELGTGSSITISNLSVSEHTITLIGTDSHGNTADASISIQVLTNEPPAVSITNPADGSTIGDRTQVTFSGSANDPEDGFLSGGALAWTSSRDGHLGTGTSVTRSGLSVGDHVVTLTATDSDGGSASATVRITIFDEPPPLLIPNLVYDGVQSGTNKLSVSNWADYDPELFVLDSSLPPCGLNTNAGRTWVGIFAGNGSRIYGYCGIDDRSGLTSLFVVLPSGSPPPESVYIDLWDRATDRRVRSNRVAIPSADPCRSEVTRPTTPGQTHDDSLMSSDCVLLEGPYADGWEFTLAEPTAIVFTMTSSVFDAVLLVTDPQLDFLAFDDDSGGGTDARIFYQFDSGTYIVWATSFASGVTGMYRLTSEIVEVASCDVPVGSIALKTRSRALCRSRAVSETERSPIPGHSACRRTLGSALR